MWQTLQKNLNDPRLRPDVVRLLNLARYFGTFGSGSGGQLTEYVFAKIIGLSLTEEQRKTNFYVQCGKWWSKYSKLFPEVPEQSDVVLIRTTEPMDAIVVNDTITDVSKISSVRGISVKASHKATNSVKKIHAMCKAYASTSTYAKNTFGQLFKWFNESIEEQTDPQFHDDHLFPQGWRDPKFNTFHEVLIGCVQKQIRQRLKTDPIKVQFAKDKVLIFRIPITELWKSVSVRTLLPNPKFNVCQGRFNVTTMDGKKILTVMGDRIMICQGFPKQLIQVIQIDLPPYDVKQFLEKFDGFISST